VPTRDGLVLSVDVVLYLAQHVLPSRGKFFLALRVTFPALELYLSLSALHPHIPHDRSCSHGEDPHQ
jgi:hypothetical protein